MFREEERWGEQEKYAARKNRDDERISFYQKQPRKSRDWVL
jgi:hypothetical protein